jgi:hypothetical protein
MRREIAVALACVSVAGLLANAPAVSPPTARTVYVTVVDGQGHAVPYLTPADFVVKEGGREHEIVSVTPASEPMRLALMVDHPLVGATDVRQGLAGFVTRMCPPAEIALYMISRRAEKMVNFISNRNVLIDGIRDLPLSQPAGSGAVPDAVFEVAKQFTKDKPARPVIVLATTEQGMAVADPEYLLSEIAKSKAQFWAVSFGTTGPASVSGLRVPISLSIADGLQQSGGRRIPILTLPGFLDGLQQVADDLSSQYLITYALPSGVKPSERLSVSLKKPGVTLRAPSRVPK